jgi:hypothetical protein
MKKWLFVALFAGCGRITPPHVTAVDAERSHVAVGELERGRSLLVSKCGASCHSAPLPSQHTAREWPASLDEMSSRANLSFGDRHLIEEYLVAMSRE